jgi:hypothetical protein
MLALCIMSALPVANWLNDNTPMWLGNNGSINLGTISTLNTNHVVLDGQSLDCTSAAGGTLLINGQALASATGLTSSIANWAQFPALSTIAYTTSGGSGGTINMSVGQFSTLQNLAGSISSLNVSSINGYNANSSGGVIIDATNTYSYSTSNATPTTSPTQVAGVATGLYTLVVGKKYQIAVPVNGYLGSTDGVLYMSASLGTASTQCFPQALDSASSHTTGQLEPRILSGVVTATATDAGLYLYIWRGSITFTPNSSLQIYVNPATVAGGLTNGGITITQLT